MRSSIGVLYIALFFASGFVYAQLDADALYRERATAGQAEAAADLWEQQLEGQPGRLRRGVEAGARDVLARHAWAGCRRGGQPSSAAWPRDGRRRCSRPRVPRGISGWRPTWARWPSRSGCARGCATAAAIKDALETVLRIDPAFQQGSADRALGRWYYKVPGLFGGSKQKSEEHLRKSLTYNPDSTASHFFLAETLFELNRDREAREELQKVIAGPVDPEWEPEDRDFKDQARRRLK